MQKFILASASPRRKAILELALLNFDILPAETEESFPPDLSPEQVAIHVAREKGIAARNKPVFRQYEDNHPVLAADTIVVVDNKIIGKPADAEDAFNILRLLSGRTHLVITGVVISTKEKEIAFHEITEVSFNVLSDSDINFYVKEFEPFDKAGAYAIQEWIGVIGINGIKGDYYNVMGLPVSRVVTTLNDHF